MFKFGIPKSWFTANLLQPATDGCVSAGRWEIFYLCNCCNLLPQFLRQVWTSLNEEDIKRRWRYRVGNFNILISLRNDIIEAFIIGTPTDVGRRFGWSCLSISGAQWCKTMELFSRVKWRNVSTQNGKLLYLWQTHNAWQHSTLVWLLGWSVCSSPSTKELHGKIFSNYLTHWCLNEPRSVTANKRIKLAFAQLANNFGFWPSCTVSIVLAFH